MSNRYFAEYTAATAQGGSVSAAVAILAGVEAVAVSGDVKLSASLAVAESPENVAASCTVNNLGSAAIVDVAAVAGISGSLSAGVSCTIPVLDGADTFAADIGMINSLAVAAERILSVIAENRVLAIDAEPRVIVIPRESRILNVKQE